uniref:WW domain-containing protein n=1 Tax=Phaeomonas parva TaxID=124430 RepID=A0A7S1U5F7_9STRA
MEQRGSPNHNVSAYRAQAHDLPEIQRWMVDLLSLGKAGPAHVPDEDSFAFYWEQYQRFDVCSRELNRQVAVHNETLFRLLEKSRRGVQRIFDKLKDAYQCEVDEKERLQASLSAVADQAQREKDAHKNHVSDIMADFSVIKAKLRNKQADFDSQRSRCKEQENELDRMRRTIGKYIEGSLVDDPKEATVRDREPYAPSRIRNNASRRAKDLFSLDDQADELLAKIVKEQEKQVTFLEDMDRHVSSVDRRVFRLKSAVTVYNTAEVECQTEESALQQQAEAPEAAGGGGGVNVALHPCPVATELDVLPVGRHVPYELRQLMTAFPLTRRVPTLKSVMSVAMQIFRSKIEADREARGTGGEILSLSDVVHQFFFKKYGLDNLVNLHLSQLLLGLEHHNVEGRIPILRELLGINLKHKPVGRADRDIAFILGFLDELQQVVDMVAQENSKENVIEVHRDHTKDCAKAYLARFVPDGGMVAAQRIRVMPAPVSLKSQHCVSFDLVLQEMFRQWTDVTAIWTEHLKYVFNKHCEYFSVVRDMEFADDKGAREQDCILVEVDRNEGLKKRRRTMRVYQGLTDDEDTFAKPSSDAASRRRLTALVMGNDEANRPHFNQSVSTGQVSVSNASNGVVALLSQDIFCEALRLMDPEISDDACDMVYRHACALYTKETERLFEKLWATKVDRDTGQAFYINTENLRTQWTPPYHMENFIVEDVEERFFVRACLDFDVLVNGPFCRILDKRPQDVWESTEIYLGRIKDGTI